MPVAPASFAEISTEHAFRHQLRPDGRESLAHMFVFPEDGIAGFVYPSVRADGRARGRASLFGPALAELRYEQVDELAPETMNFDDWRTGPLRMRVTEPHRKVDMAWDGTRITFDGHFEAMHPAYAFSSRPPGVPPYYGDDRTEQHGRVTAHLTAPGIDLQVSGFLIRDHSWGPRVWGINQHHKWFHAVTEQCSLHFFEMQAFGRRHLCGYLYRDATMGHVAEVDYEISYDEQMMHDHIRASVVDDRGREAIVDSTTFASEQVDADPMVYLNEAALTVRVDGQSGTGWCEFCWNRNYVDFARGYLGMYG
jgi:hypothetical protein